MGGSHLSLIFLAESFALPGVIRYYTQDFCQRLVNELNAKRDPNVTTEVFDTVVDQVLQDPPPTLEYFWDSLRLPVKIAIAALAALLDTEHEAASLDAAYAALPRVLLEEIESQRVLLSGGISRLLSGNWLLMDGEHYRFRIDLLRLWLRREHPIAQLEYEIMNIGIAGARQTPEHETSW